MDDFNYIEEARILLSAMLEDMMPDTADALGELDNELLNPAEEKLVRAVAEFLQDADYPDLKFED